MKELCYCMNVNTSAATTPTHTYTHTRSETKEANKHQVMYQAGVIDIIYNALAHRLFVCVSLLRPPGGAEYTQQSPIC